MSEGRLNKIRERWTAPEAIPTLFVLDIGAADVRYLLERIEALARLVEKEPTFTSEFGWADCCVYCEAGENNGSEHRENCPWRQARELLAGEAVDAT